MWQYLIPGGIELGRGLLRYANRPKTTPFAETDYGRLLKGRSKRGLYPKGVRAGILGEVGSETGNVAAMQRARIRGGLVSGGMHGSIASIRALGEPGRERMRTMGKVSGGLMTENELSKTSAEEEFAKLSTMTEEQRRREKINAIDNLVGGLAGAGMMGVTEILEKMEYEELLELFKKLLGGEEKEGGETGKSGLVGGGYRVPRYVPLAPKGIFN